MTAAPSCSGGREFFFFFFFAFSDCSSFPNLQSLLHNYIKAEFRVRMGGNGISAAIQKILICLEGHHCWILDHLR